jgi:two-component sensor histidine kinase
MDEDSAAQLDGVRGSIQAMAGIHEGLYSRGTGEQIDTKDFFSNLEQNLIRSDQDEVNLSVKTDQFNTDIDTVVSIGIILNELFTNSLKYAFEPGDDKRIEIELRRGEDSLVLKYRDYGKGVQVQANDERSTSFGMKMIKATMRKLKAELLEEHPERGVSYTFIINRFQRF